MTQSKINQLMEQMRKEVIAGLRHGFFEYSISADVEKGRRRVTLKAGRHYRFNIPEHEIVTYDGTAGDL